MWKKNKPYKFPVKDLYHNFDTLAIPILHIHQLLILVHKFLHHKHLLSTAFANYSVSQKNIPDIFSRNSIKHCRIFTIFGTFVTDEVSNQ